MEEILKKVEVQLSILGYKIDNRDKDQNIIEYLINKHSSQIIHICSIEKLTEPLQYILVDRVCADFLKNKIALGEDTGISLSTIATSIKIGDTSIEFPKNSSNEEKINLILEKLERKDFDYSPYAKMGW